VSLIRDFEARKATWEETTSKEEEVIRYLIPGRVLILQYNIIPFMTLIDTWNDQ